MSIQRARAALPVLPAGGAAATYADKVLSYSPIAYWPLNDASGTTAAAEVGTDGTYSAADIAGAGSGFDDGGNSPLFVPADSDYVDIYSSGLEAALDPNELSVSMWIKVRDASVWSDGTQRWALRIRMDSNPSLELPVNIRKGSAANTIEVQTLHDGTSFTNSTNTVSTAGYFHIGYTKSSTAGEAKLYIAGSQIGGATSITKSSNGATLVTTDCRISGSGGICWDGEIAHLALFDGVLNDAAILDLATV